MEEKKKHNNRTEDFFMIGHLGHLGVRYKTPPPLQNIFQIVFQLSEIR